MLSSSVSQTRLLWSRSIHSEQDAENEVSAFFRDDSSFIHPSVDGAELSNRWDMHHHPPDILITNVSMLSAMLNREAEEPIFKKTRKWLEENDDAYFYLVMDELHLQRGAAGTEVAYLIRLLLHRLGLTRDEKSRRKIRILASSASLPANPAEKAKQSAKYLWDMFGTLGLEPDLDPEEGRKLWLDAIIPGEEESPAYSETAPPRVESVPFLRLLEHHASAESLDRSEAAIELVSELDRRCGGRLPAAVKEWYSLDGAVNILSKKTSDHLVPLEELGKVFDDWYGGGRRDFVAEGYLVIDRLR